MTHLFIFGLNPLKTDIKPLMSFESLLENKVKKSSDEQGADSIYWTSNKQNDSVKKAWLIR